MGAFRDPCGERDFEELIATLVEQVKVINALPSHALLDQVTH